jgi:WD40 repeat protein
LTGSEDLHVHLWDGTDSLRKRRTIDVYDYVIGSLEFSRDGKHLAAACWEGTVKIYDLPEGKVRAKMFYPKERPFALAFSATGADLYIGFYEGRIRRCATDGAVKDDWPDPAGGVACLALSPNGRWLAWSGSWQGPVFVRDLEKGTVERYRRREPSCLRALVFSPAGNLLAGADDRGAISLWDLVPAPATSDEGKGP